MIQQCARDLYVLDLRMRHGRHSGLLPFLLDESSPVLLRLTHARLVVKRHVTRHLSPGWTLMAVIG